MTNDSLTLLAEHEGHQLAWNEDAEIYEVYDPEGEEWHPARTLDHIQYIVGRDSPLIDAFLDHDEERAESEENPMPKYKIQQTQHFYAPEPDVVSFIPSDRYPFGDAVFDNPDAAQTVIERIDNGIYYTQQNETGRPTLAVIEGSAG